MKRKLLTVLAFSTMLFGLVGCGSNSSKDTSKEENKTLSFMYAIDNQEQKTAIKWLTDKYEEEKGVKVDLIEMSSSDLKTKLKNAVVSNDQPDVVKVTGLDQSYYKNLVDLTDIYNNNKFKPTYAWTDKEKIISPALGLTAVGMFINKDLWDQAGVSYPTSPDEVWTWDEFSEKAREVVAKSDAKYGLVMDKSEHRLRNYLYQWGVRTQDDSGEGTYYASKKAESAYQYFVDMSDDVLIPRSVYLSGEDGASMFKTGRVAAYYSGSWQIGDFAKNVTNFEYQAVYMPYEEKRTTNPGGDYIAAFEGTGKEKEAKEFIEWIYSEKVYSEFAGKYGYLPALEDVTPTYEQDDASYQVFLNELNESWDAPMKDKSTARDMSIVITSTDGVIIENLVKAINGDLTVEEATKKIGEEYHEATGVKILE